jgi:CRP/FNR family cyclic AMP-dependent transcriptional regulator
MRLYEKNTKAEYINIFLEHAHPRRYPARSTLIYAGDHGESLFLLVKDSVSVIIENEDGREMVCRVLKALEEQGLVDVAGKLWLFVALAAQPLCHEETLN